MKKRFKFSLVVLMSAVLILSLPALSQEEKSGLPIPGTTQSLRFDGWIQLFHGPASHIAWLEAEIKINKGVTKLPLTGAKVTLIDKLLSETGPGTYTGDIHPYNVVSGQRIDIKLRTPPPLLKQSRVVHVTIDNMIKWKFPSPDAEIDVRSARSFTFEWDFLGATKTTLVRIKDWGTKQTVFQETVSGASVLVQSNVFQPGRTYRIYQVTSDWDVFQLYPVAAPGSEIKFYYTYILFFKTK